MSLNFNTYSKDKELIGKLMKEEINQSKISQSTLYSYFIENRKQLVKFMIAFYKSEIKIDDGEEYPIGEGVSDEEKTKTLKSYGMGIGFGITCSIYFHFLVNDKLSDLADYLKVRKIPYSNKFYKRLIGCYNESKVNESTTQK